MTTKQKEVLIGALDVILRSSFHNLKGDEVHGGCTFTMTADDYKTLQSIKALLSNP